MIDFDDCVAAIACKSGRRPRPRPGPDFRGQNLRGESWVDRDLQGADFRGADLRGCDLRGADLFGARLDEADLREALIDVARVIEIRIPAELDLRVVNQIRYFDFKFASTRFVGPNRASEPLTCPYADDLMKPLLYEWGSRTWNRGRGWEPPRFAWTLQEIVAAVLDEIGCRHDLLRACNRIA